MDDEDTKNMLRTLVTGVTTLGEKVEAQGKRVEEKLEEQAKKMEILSEKVELAEAHGRESKFFPYFLISFQYHFFLSSFVPFISWTVPGTQTATISLPHLYLITPPLFHDN